MSKTGSVGRVTAERAKHLRPFEKTRANKRERKSVKTADSEETVIRPDGCCWGCSNFNENDREKCLTSDKPSGGKPCPCVDGCMKMPGTEICGQKCVHYDPLPGQSSEPVIQEE